MKPMMTVVVPIRLNAICSSTGMASLLPASA